MSRELTAPSERLIAAAQLAAAILFEGEQQRSLRAIDVGCDHAKLAIYLVQSGICSHVLACDINDGPVAKAREAVLRRKNKSESLSRFITVVQNDGLQGLADIPADRVFILGMGGELIADILERAPFVRDASRRTAFVLQAMTGESDLRRYLCQRGFVILREKLVRDKGRIYSLLLCRYDGVERHMNEALLSVGEYHVYHPDHELFLPYIDRKIRIQTKIVDKLVHAGMVCGSQETLLDELVMLRKRAAEQLKAEGVLPAGENKELYQ